MVVLRILSQLILGTSGNTRYSILRLSIPATTQMAQLWRLTLANRPIFQTLVMQDGAPVQATRRIVVLLIPVVQAALRVQVCNNLQTEVRKIVMSITRKRALRVSAAKKQ